MSKKNRSKQIDALTGIRGYAILFVFAYHIITLNYSYELLGYDLGIGRYIRSDLLRNIAEFGWFGVDIFFILSGFIISYKYYGILSQEVSLRTTILFILRRLARIYPLYIFSIIILLGIHYLGGWDNALTNMEALPYHLTLTYAWWFYPFGETWNLPGWTLSAEFFVYLIFPIIVFIYRPGLASAVIAVLLIIWYLSTYPAFYILGAGALKKATTGFFLGFFFYQIHRNIKNSNFIDKHSDLIGFIALLCLIASLAFSHSIYNFLEPLTIAYPCAALVIFSLYKCKNILLYIFANKPIVFIGKVSYSAYVMHFPVITFLNLFRQPLHKYFIIENEASQSMLMLFLCSLILFNIIIATIAHYSVERPFLFYFRRIIKL